MKRHILNIALILLILKASSQKMKVITLDKSEIEVEIISDSLKKNYLQDFKGKQDNSVRKQWTARTFILSDKRLLIELFDKQAVLIKSKSDFEKLREIRFVKNYIDFLKKDVSYKIEMSHENGTALSKSAKRITNLKSSSPEDINFEVYELVTNQILFIYKSEHTKSAAVYENMKALSSDNSDVLSQYYQGMENWSQKLIAGDPLLDYELTNFSLYPADVSKLIKNHKLSLVESKIYVSNFYGNLYKSEKGYFILIDEVNQKNGAGSKMRILSVRTYETLEDVRNDQSKYAKSKTIYPKSEHFFQKISDQYGKDFPSQTKLLIEKLPNILNFDREQLTFDSIGMPIVDEAIRWNHDNYELFNDWFPSVLAYYGECFMKNKSDGKWVIKKEQGYGVLVPHLVLSDNEDAFDVYDFFKSLNEWPLPIKEIGDWDGYRRRYRMNIKTQNSR